MEWPTSQQYIPHKALGLSVGIINPWYLHHGAGILHHICFFYTAVAMNSDDESRNPISATHPSSEGAPSPGYPQVTPKPFTLLNVKNSPVPLKITWSRRAVLPCKFGVRKDVLLLGDLLRQVPRFAMTNRRAALHPAIS